MRCAAFGVLCWPTVRHRHVSPYEASFSVRCMGQNGRLSELLLQSVSSHLCAETWLRYEVLAVSGVEAGIRRSAGDHQAPRRALFLTTADCFELLSAYQIAAIPSRYSGYPIIALIG